MLSFDLHTHEHLVRALIFSGRPEAVGLNQDEWQLTQPWTPLVIPPPRFTSSMAELGSRVEACSASACAYEPTVELVGGLPFVRRGYPRCGTSSNYSFKLRKGEFTTVLGFFDTRPSAAKTMVEYVRLARIRASPVLSERLPHMAGTSSTSA